MRNIVTNIVNVALIAAPVVIGVTAGLLDHSFGTGVAFTLVGSMIVMAITVLITKATL